MNAFVDEILKKKRRMFRQKIGSIKLPDKEFEFSGGEGKAKLVDGCLDGLGDIVRKGDCTLSFDNDVLSVEAVLGAEKLLGRCHVEVDYSWPVGGGYDVNVKIESLTAVIKGTQTFNDLKNPEILNFDVALNVRVDVGDIDIDLGNFIVEWMAKAKAMEKVDSLKLHIQEMLKNQIRNAVTKFYGTSILTLLAMAE